MSVDQTLIDVRERLEEALSALDEEERRMNERRAVLHRTLNDLKLSAERKSRQRQGNGGGGGQTRKGKASDEVVSKVLEHLRSNPDGVRQADIGPALNLNPGLVSMALRQLREASQANKGEKFHGSTLWQSSNVRQGSRNKVTAT